MWVTLVDFSKTMNGLPVPLAMQNVKEVIMNALELLLPRTYTAIVAHKFWLNN